jgi:O-antigen ligase
MISRPNSDRSPRGKIYTRVIEYGLLGLLILTPLPAGSVYEWSILGIQLTVLGLFMAYVLMKRKPQSNELLRSALKWPRHLFTLFFAFVFVQFIPLPKFLVRLFSPNAYDFQKTYAVDFARIKLMSFSLIPSLTFQRALELLAYVLLGFIILNTVTRRRQFIRIYSVLVAVGAFEAFYGMFELYSGNPRILFFQKIHNLDSVTGTFVNRNHLSGYLEMVIPLAIGLIIARINLFSGSHLTFREWLLRLGERGLATNVLLGLAVVVMAVAIIFSNSRSGVFILIFTFILFFGFTALHFGVSRLRRKRVRNFLQVAFIVIIFISLYVGIGRTLERFSLDRLLSQGRPTYWLNTMRTFSDYPIFGTGLGTFGPLYPNMEDEAGPVALVHAHNDYLEYLSELGLVGFSLLLGGILFIGVVSFLVWRVRRHPEVKGLALGGIVSLLAILIHSVTDFNLHIPANMVLFSAVLTMTMAIAFYKRGAVPAEKP